MTAAANKVRGEKDELVQPELTEPQENNALSLKEPELKLDSVLETEQPQERQFNIHIPDSEPAKSEGIEIETKAEVFDDDIEPMFERTKQLDATIEELDAAAQHENDYAPQESEALRSSPIEPCDVIVQEQSQVAKVENEQLSEPLKDDKDYPIIESYRIGTARHR